MQAKKQISNYNLVNKTILFIEKLSPHLKKIAFYTVEISFKVEA
jgi:hypothetical protein